LDDGSHGIDNVVARMDALLAPLRASGSPRRHFLETYRRTTIAVGQAITRGGFEDPDWVERWDVVFAGYYLDALEAFEADPATAPRPWRIALSADAARPPLVHLLLGVNAHINLDLPQALLDVVPTADINHQPTLERRKRDHERIDAILSGRVAAEDAELAAAGRAARTLIDRLMTPLNRVSSKRFLREARQRVWHNTIALDEARGDGPDALAGRVAELDVLASARIADLLRPGFVLLRLATAGFGVALPPR